MQSLELSPQQKKECGELTKRLVDIPSSANDSPRIYQFTFDYLKEKGLPVKKQENPLTGLPNLYVKLGNGNGPKVLLNGHLDTIQPITNPKKRTTPRERGGKIYGLGAADMKGGCASAIVSTLALSEQELNGTLFLSLVHGEEAPFSLGSHTLIKEFGFKDYDLVIVTEPSPILARNDFCTVHKRVHPTHFPTPIIGAMGRIMYYIEFFGKSVHASHPSQGINALEDAAKVINMLGTHKPQSTSKMEKGGYTVLNIDGGDPSFTVPSYCELLVNRNISLGEKEKDVTRELERIVRELKLRSDVKVKERPMPDKNVAYRPYLFEKSDYIDKFMEVISKEHDSMCKFTTSSVGDFNLFATRTKVPTLVFGPGGGNIHSPHEYVEKKQIVQTTEYLLNFFGKVF